MRKRISKIVVLVALALLCVVGFLQLSAPVVYALNCPPGFGSCTFEGTRLHGEPDCLYLCCIYECPWGEEIGPCELA